jgi:hypothetical protein
MLVPAQAAIDIKKLGRFNAIGHRITGNRAGQSNQHSGGVAPGWEYVHVAIDDHSRLAFSQVMPDEKHRSVRVDDGGMQGMQGMIPCAGSQS